MTAGKTIWPRYLTCKTVFLIISVVLISISVLISKPDYFMGLVIALKKMNCTGRGRNGDHSIFRSFFLLKTEFLEAMCGFILI